MTYPNILNRFFGSEVDTANDQSDATPPRPRRQRSWTVGTVRGDQTGPSEGAKEYKTADVKELDDLRAKLSRTDSHLSQLQEQHSNLLQSYHTVANENRSLRTFTSQTVRDLESAHEEKNSLEQELQACKDDLFQMNPSSDVPDSAIAHGYDDLYEHISGWVEAEISRSERSLRRTQPGLLPDMFHHSGMPTVKKLLSSHPTSGGEYFVRYVVQMMLQNVVLSKEILLSGLDESHSMLLRLIAQSMAKAMPPRAPESIKTWRSDTLSALSVTMDLQKSRQKVTRNAGINILLEVAKFLMTIERSEASLQVLLDKVIQPAVELAVKIQISSATYDFRPKMDAVPLLDNCIFSQKHLSSMKLVDIATGKTLKADSPVQANEKGEIGTRVMMLAPALYRCDPGKDPLLLVKPTFVVQLYKPLGRRQAATGHSR
ncbi:MAG: hypothetical protein Q9197_001397 [Variospora fuerteventurae]